MFGRARSSRLRRHIVAVAILWATRALAAGGATPPRIVETAPADYPADGGGESREVVLVVVIDAEGRVVDAKPDSGEVDAWASAAIDAAKKYRFEPARRGNTPVPSKIKLKIAVAPPAPAPAPAPAPEPAPGPAPAPPPAAEEAEEVNVRGDASSPSPTRRTMDRRAIETMPGAGGDALRTVEALPGVARAPSFSGLLIVRGSAPQDTQVFVDHASVPLAYHFGGLAAIVPTELLERIDMYPGNYDVMFGRGLGGIVDVGLRGPARDEAHGLAKVDLLDARVLAETPIDAHTRVLVAARRSWIDAWLPSVASSVQLGVVAAPVYYDYQAIIERDLSSRATLRGTFIGSNDRLVLTLPPGMQDASFAGDLSNTTSFWRAQVRADGKLEGGTRWLTMASVGHDTFSIALGKLHGDDDVVRLGARAQIDAPITRALRARAGVDVEGGQFDFQLVFPPVPAAGEPDTGPMFGKAPLREVHHATFLNPAAYAALELVPDSRWKVIGGVRVESFSDVPGVDIEPRANVRYAVTRDFPRTTAKAAAGLFAQQPQPYENAAVFGTPGIAAEHAAHASIGLEQEVTRHVELSIEPFYKELYDMVSRRVDAASPSGFRYGNEARGFSYGTEFLLKYKPDERFWGWIAYTISRAERRALPEQNLYVFEYDQTHVLSALGSYRLGRGWEAGVRVRYVTGNPYTPILGGAFDADAGAYAPIEQRPINSSRLPPFFSLDLRIEKTWRLGARAKLSAYLDVQNATNRSNVESITTNFDGSLHTRAQGLPILPNFGVRGEL